MAMKIANFSLITIFHGIIQGIQGAPEGMRISAGAVAGVAPDPKKNGGIQREVLYECYITVLYISFRTNIIYILLLYECYTSTMGSSISKMGSSISKT